MLNNFAINLAKDSAGASSSFGQATVQGDSGIEVLFENCRVAIMII